MNGVTLDWHVPISTIVVLLMQIGAAYGAYYGLKAENATTRASMRADNAELQSITKADNAKLESSMQLAFLSVRADMIVADGNVKEAILAVVSRIELGVTDLTHRVGTLENGQDEWTKSLRTRTHELAEKVNTLMLKVDRLERPVKGEAR